jgi:precorrin isomerase
MSTVQKWLMGLIGLGAGYMVLQNPNGFYKAATGIEHLTAGSVTQISTGGRRGG